MYGLTTVRLPALTLNDEIDCTRVDRRLRVLSRLRGKDPTPEPEVEASAPPPGMQPSQQFGPRDPPAGGSDSGTGRLSQVQSWR